MAFWGAFSRKAFTFAVAVSRSRCLADFVAHAMWGVIQQFLAVSSGLSGFGGSVERTSRPAAAI